MDTSRVIWRKASCSAQNSACVEVGTWRKASYSAQNSTCVEVGASREPTAGLLCLVRDTKDRGGPALAFTPTAWASFVANVKAGAFDRIA
jgi:hypothetical protein